MRLRVARSHISSAVAPSNEVLDRLLPCFNAMQQTQQYVIQFDQFSADPLPTPGAKQVNDEPVQGVTPTYADSLSVDGRRPATAAEWNSFLPSQIRKIRGCSHTIGGNVMMEQCCNFRRIFLLEA